MAGSRHQIRRNLSRQESLQIADRKDVSDLWTDAENAGAEPAEDGRLTKVVCDLLVGITYQADEQLF